jgi:hypothetical protein
VIAKLRQEANVRATLKVLGVLLVALGGIWFLQGMGVLPGSFMSGQIRWAVYGGIAVAVGVSILVALRGGGRSG